MKDDRMSKIVFFGNSSKVKLFDPELGDKIRED